MSHLSGKNISKLFKAGKKAVVVSLFVMALCSTGTVYSQAGGSAGGGAGGGGGGGGGGSLYGFKYILYPRYDTVENKRWPLFKASLRHFYHNLFLGSLRSRIQIKNYNDPDTLIDFAQIYASRSSYLSIKQFIDTQNVRILNLSNNRQLDTATKSRSIRQLEELKSTRSDSLKSLFSKTNRVYEHVYGTDKIYYYRTVAVDNSVPVYAINSFFLMKNSATGKLDTMNIYTKQNSQGANQALDSVSLTKFLQDEARDRNTYHKKLKVYISSISKATDSISFKIWHSVKIQKNHATPFGLNADTAYKTDFSLVVPWNDTSGEHRKFILPFRTKYLIAVNVPFLYDHNTDSFAVSFLNAGIAYGFAFGRTKFYQYNQLPPRNSYFGFGPLINLSSTVSAGNSSSSNLAKLVVGMHVGYSTGTVQFLAIAGYYYNVTPKHGFQIQCKPIYGFGFGLSLFNFSVPTASSQAGGH